MKLDFRYHAQPEDVATVREILESSGFFLPHEVPEAINLLNDKLQKGNNSAYHFIFAETAGNVPGYICYGLMSCSILSYGVYFLAVHEQYRAQHIGKQLLLKAEEKIKERNGKNIFIETASKPLYEPTRKFYHKMNYTIEAVLKDFYDVNDDKVIFSKHF